MKKIFIPFFLVLFTFNWQLKAQFSENFDTGVPGSMTQIYINNSINWTDCGGDSGPAMCPYNGSGSAHFFENSNSGSQTALITPVMDLSNDSYMLEFSHVQPVWSGDQNILIVEISMDSGANWTQVVEYTNDISDWTDELIFLDNFNLTATTQIRFVGTNLWGYAIGLDDIVVEPVPSCISVSGLSASNITANSATLTWTPRGNETAWNIEYGPSGFTQGQGTLVAVNTNSYNLTGLDGFTTYNVYVQADCGGGNTSSWVGPLTFSTACPAYFTAPYSESFESGSLSCWTNENYTDQLNWDVHSGSTYTSGTGPDGAYDGDYYLYVESGGSNHGNNAIIYSPYIDLSSLSVPRLQFYYHMFGGGMDPNGNIDVAISTDGNASFTSIFNEQGNHGNQWNHAVINLSGYTGIVSFRIMGTISSSGNTSQNDFAIDNFIVDDTPSCPSPFSLFASNMTSDSADLSWTETGSATTWNVEYGVTGFTQGQGTLVTASSNPYTLTGLNSSTTYDFYVQADCGGGDTSTWAGPYTFTTAGTCGFYKVDLLNSTGNGWYNSTLTVYINGVEEMNLTLANGSDTGSHYFPVDVNDILSFDYTPGYYSTNDEYKVYDNNNVLLADEGANQTEPGDIGNPSIPNGLQACPSCSKPTNFSASNISFNSVDLSWIENGNATAWNIEYGPAGFLPGHGQGTIEYVTSNPYTLTGLDSATIYDVYVQAYCGNGDSSIWVGPVNFETTCPAFFTAPYTVSFETGDLSCWSNDTNDNLDWTVYSGPTNSSSTGPDSAYDGNYYLYVESSNTSHGYTAVIYSPEIDISSLTIPRLNFYYHMYGTGMDPDGSIDVAISADGGVTYTSIFNEQGNHGNQWNQAIVYLSAYSGVVTFRITGTISSSGDTYQNDFAIDNFVIEESPSCPPPANLYVDNITDNSADLSWTENGSATAWNIEYGPTGFTPGQGTMMATNTNPTAITGLNSNTTYDFYVQADCGNGDTSTWAGPYTFTTLCSIFIPPFSESFETGDISCWFNETADQLDWEVHSGPTSSYGTGPDSASDGTNYLFVESSGSSFGDQAVIYSPKIDLSSLTTPRLRFDYHMYGTGMSPDGAIDIAISTDRGITYTGIFHEQSNHGNQWHHASVDLSAYSGVVSFKITGTVSSSSSSFRNDFAIDNIVIDETPTCLEPYFISPTNITGESVELSWTDPGSASNWNIEYGPAGFTQGQGTVVAANSNPFTITGLNATTTYDYYIQTDCGGGDTSPWVGPNSFTTTYAPGTCGMFRVDLISVRDRGWIGASLNVYINGTIFWSGITLTDGSGPESYEIPVDTDDILTFEYISGPGQNSQNQYIVYDNNNVVVAHAGTHGIPESIGDPATPSGLQACTTCFAPSDLSASYITDEKAKLSWTENGNATAWNIEYGPTGFTQGQGTIVVANTNIFTLTGLTATTTYDYYVQADCGGGDDSVWIGPYSFTTIEAPGTCGFFRVDLMDSDSDGWSGGSLTVYINGTAYLSDITLDYGSSLQPFYIPVDTGDVLSFEYTPGSWSYENQYIVYDNNNNEVANEGANGTPGNIGDPTVPTGLEACPPCPKPTNLSVSNLVADSVNLSWTENGSATNWNIEYGPAGFTQGQGTTVSVNTNLYALTGLTPNTTYDVYVQSDCGSDWTGPVTFHTPCFIVSTFPYSYGFENVTSNTGGDWSASCWSGNPENTGGNYNNPPFRWTPNSGSTPHTSYSGTNAAHSGSMYAYTSAFGGDNGDVAELISPVFDLTGLNHPKLTFYYYMFGSSMGSLSVDFFDGTTWSNDVWSLSGEQQTSANEPWLQATVYLSNAVTQIRFRSIRGGIWSDMAIDDIVIEEGPTCPPPIYLSIDNVTGNSADISWNEIGSATAWNIEYGPAGFTHGQGTTVAVTSNSYTLTGLNTFTTYDCYVQSDCGGGDISSWTGPITFDTPGSCGFYRVDLIDPNGNGWGSSKLTVFVNGAAYLTDLTLPSGSGLTSYYIPVDQGDIMSFDFSGSIGSDVYIYKVYDTNNTLVVTEGEVGRPEDFGDPLLPSGLLACPSCPTPTDLSYANPDGYSVELSWTENGSATSWNIEYGLHGFLVGNGVTINNVTGNPYTLTGLTPLSAYDYYVQADCGNGDTSWVGPKRFFTGCGAITPPWSESFENNFNFSCWENTGTYYSTHIHKWLVGRLNPHGPTFGSNGGHYLMYNIYGTPGGNTTTATTPVFDMTSLIHPQLSFDYWMKGPADPDLWLKVEMSTDGVTWNEIFFQEQDGYINGWTSAVVPLSGVTSNTRFRFIAVSDSGSYNTAIDNLVVGEGTSCQPPYGLHTSNLTDNSVDLSWTRGYQETAWNIQYGPAGFTPGQGTQVTVNTDSYALTGLSPITTYDVYVQADCGNGSTSTWVGPLTFTTHCPSYFTAPYVESFENNVNCWNSGYGQLDWTVHSGATPSNNTGPDSAYDGTNYLYVESSNGSANGYSAVVYSPEIDLSSLTLPRLHFFYHMYGAGMEPDGSIDVAISTDGGTTYTSIFNEQGNHGNQWNEAIVYLQGYSGMVSFRVRGTISSTGVTYENDFAIDNFIIEESPSCPPPTDLTTSNISYDSAVLSWTENGSANTWNIEYGPAGFTQGNGTTVVATSNPYTLTGLNSITTYDYYVQADCGSGDTSTWEGPFTFVTPGTCGIYRVELLDSHGDGWNNGKLTVYINGVPYLTDITLPAGSGPLSFDIPVNRLDVLSFAYSPGLWSSENEYKVYDDNNNLIADQGISYQHPGNIGNPAIPNGIQACAVCQAPNNLYATNIYGGSADLFWTENGSTTAWNIQYGPAGFTFGQGTIIAVTNRPYTLTGLNALNTYDFYVQADCGNGDVSTWEGPYTFSTPCDTYTAPYYDGFEYGGSLGCWINETTDDQINWSINMGPTQSSDTGPDSAHNGSFYLYIESSPPTDFGDEAIIYSPNIDLSALTAPQLSFYYHMYGTGMDPDGSIDVAITTNNGNSYTNIFHEQGNQGNQWLRAVIDLSAYSGIVSFKITGTISSNGASWENDFAVDDFIIDNASAVNELTNVLGIYPNPTTGQFIIKSYDLKNAKVFVYTITGKEIFNGTIDKDDYIVNLRNVKQGVYLVKITSRNKNYFSKIIVK